MWPGCSSTGGIAGSNGHISPHMVSSSQESCLQLARAARSPHCRRKLTHNMSQQQQHRSTITSPLRCTHTSLCRNCCVLIWFANCIWRYLSKGTSNIHKRSLLHIYRRKVTKGGKLNYSTLIIHEASTVLWLHNTSAWLYTFRDGWEGGNKPCNMLEQSISEPKQLACWVLVLSFHGAQAI